MTKQEKVTHTALLNQIRDFEREVHDLSCKLGDYADGVCELKVCLERGEVHAIPYVQQTLVNIYKKHKKG